MDQPTVEQDRERFGSIAQSEIWEKGPVFTDHREQDTYLVQNDEIPTAKMQILLRNVSRALKCQSMNLVDLKQEQQVLKERFHESLDGFRDIQVYLEDKAELAVKLDECESDIKTMQDENRNLKTLLFRAKEEKDNMLQILRGLL